MLGKHEAMTHTIGMVTAMKTKPHSDKKLEAEREHNSSIVVNGAVLFLFIKPCKAQTIK